MGNIEISKTFHKGKLPGRFLKDGAKILLPICLLVKFATSPSHGIFPVCKVAKLKPIFKIGKKIDPSNYRPILWLPLISKIIKKLVHNQTNEFLSANKILYNYQSGFRTNYSTNQCLSLLTDKILKNFESFLAGMILINLQKAFEQYKPWNHVKITWIYRFFG